MPVALSDSASALHAVCASTDDGSLSQLDTSMTGAIVETGGIFMGSLDGGTAILALVLGASMASKMSRMPRMGSAGRVRSTSHTAEAKASCTPCAAM